MSRTIPRMTQESQTPARRLVRSRPLGTGGSQINMRTKTVIERKIICQKCDRRDAIPFNGDEYSIGVVWRELDVDVHVVEIRVFK